MPCDSIERAKRTEFLSALRDIDQKLASGELKLVRTASGSLTIAGFADLDAAKLGWVDSCLLARLGATGSLKTRSIIRDAKLKLNIVAQRTHSH